MCCTHPTSADRSDGCPRKEIAAGCNPPNATSEAREGEREGREGEGEGGEGDRGRTRPNGGVLQSSYYQLYTSK